MPLHDEELLIKVGLLQNDHLLGLRVVELPSFVSLRIPNKDALLYVQSKTPKRPFVLLNEHISSAASNMKHGEIRLGPKKGLIWSGLRQSCGDKLVVNMDKR